MEITHNINRRFSDSDDKELTIYPPISFIFEPFCKCFVCIKINKRIRNGSKNHTTISMYDIKKLLGNTYDIPFILNQIDYLDEEAPNIPVSSFILLKAIYESISNAIKYNVFKNNDDNFLEAPIVIRTKVSKDYSDTHTNDELYQFYISNFFVSFLPDETASRDIERVYQLLQKDL